VKVIRLENARLRITDFGREWVLTIDDEDYRILVPMSRERARDLMFESLSYAIHKRMS
jgi:hypothetical protein